MKSIRKAHFKVEIKEIAAGMTLNPRYYWTATDPKTKIAPLTSSGIYQSRKAAKRNWVLFAELNKIKHYEVLK